MGGIVSAVKGNDFMEGACQNTIDNFLNGFITGAIMYCVSAGINAAVNAANKASYVETVSDDGIGFDNFKDLKKHLGPAGENKEWHHIVEQCQIEKSGFSPQQIHNTKNIIAIDKGVHTKISAFYNSRFQEFSHFRNSLVGTSFEYQYEVGISILAKFGVIV